MQFGKTHDTIKEQKQTVTKYENIQTALSTNAVTGTQLYDLKVITVEQTTQFYSLSYDEVNAVHKAFEILNERRWGRTKKTRTEATND